MLVREVLRRVCTLLTDVSPQFVRWSEGELVDWLNDGQLAIARYLPTAASRADVVRLVPGSRQVLERVPAARVLRGDGTAAADVRVLQVHDLVRNMGGDGETPGGAISIVSREVMDAQNRMWHVARARGRVEHFCVDARVPSVVYVHPPVPQEGAVWVEVLWWVCPPLVPYPQVAGEYGVAGGSSVALGIGDAQVDDLVHYVCARAWMKDAEFASASLAQFYQGLFLQSLNAQAALLTGLNPNLKVLPLSPQVPAAGS